MKIKQYENKWHDIYFNKLNTKLSLFKLPDLDFYNKFYKEFFFRYNNFDDLSENWITNKIKIAEVMEKLFPKNSSVLSYGCGIGIIEKFIVEKRNDLNLDCFDFSAVASKWLKRDLSHIYFTADHKDLKKYDYIFMVGLLYAMDDSEVINLLKKIKYFLKENGRIIICNTSLKMSENDKNIKISITESLIYFFKNLFRLTFYFLFKKNTTQFWGFRRDKKSYEIIFKKAGFTIDKSFSDVKQLFQTFKAQ
jgi:SAM-dependent methyltransferase